MSATAAWDATAPTVEIGGVPAKINSRTVLTAATTASTRDRRRRATAVWDAAAPTVTFSEAVTGFAIGDVTVTGGGRARSPP